MSGRRKQRGHAVNFRGGEGVWCTIFVQDVLVFSLHLVDVALAFSFYQNFDARFVNVVAPTPAVVDPHYGFKVIEQLLCR